MSKSKSDPCWESHEMVGMKTKGGKQVPNCVPRAKAKEKAQARQEKSSG